MTKHDIHALSGAYAVDALDDVERAAFERHLEACADCRAEVRELQETAAMLAITSEVAPPAGLRERLMADIATTRPLPPLTPPTLDAEASDEVITADTDDTTDDTDDTDEDATEDERPAATVVELSSRRRRWVSALAAAAAVAVIGAIGVGVGVTQPWNDQPGQVMSMSDRVLGAKDATRHVVAMDGARATVVRSKSVGRAVIVTENMPSPPVGKVYEVWLQVDGAMVPAGLMPRAASQTMVLEGDAADATAAGITVEPYGGSKHPTSDPIALFDFAESA